MVTATYDSVYQQGISDEKRVLEFLKSRGHEVIPSSREQNIKDDIDLFLDGVPVSVKAQHDGWCYGEVYLELATQRGRMGTPWDATQWDMVSSLAKRSSRPVFMKPGEWNPSWYFQGKAEYYLFWQQDTLRLIHKQDIKDTIEAYGFKKDKAGRQKVLGLKPETIQMQGGKNTICGFLDVNLIPHRSTWVLQVDSSRQRKYKINPL